MTKLHIPAVLAALLAPAAGQDNAASDKAPQHLLRLSYSGDGPTWLRVRQDMTMSSNVTGAVALNRIRLDLFWKIEVRRQAGDAVVVVHTLARLRGAVRDWDGVSLHDSATDSSAPARLREIVDLLGAEIASTVDLQGRVQELELPEALQNLDASSSAFLKVSDLLRPWDLELPELPVAVGARWHGSKARELAANDELAIESEYELVGVESGVARIEQRLSVTPAADTGKSVDKDPKQDTGSGRSAGLRAHRTFTLDLGTGRILRVDGDTTIEMVSRADVVPDVWSELKLTRRSEPVAEPGDLEPLEPPPAGEEKK